MKFHLKPTHLYSVILLFAPVASQASDYKSLLKLEDQYHSFGEYLADNLDGEILIDFALNPGPLKNMLKESPKCQNDMNFMPISNAQWTNIISEELGDTYEMAFEIDDGYYSFRENIEEILESLEAELTNDKLLICEDTSIPAFTHSSSLRFIKINGDLKAGHMLRIAD